MATKKQAQALADKFLEDFPEYRNFSIRISLPIDNYTTYFTVPRGPRGGLRPSALLQNGGTGTLYVGIQLGTIILQRYGYSHTSMVVLPDMEDLTYLQPERDESFSEEEMERYFEWRRQNWEMCRPMIAHEYGY